MSAYALAECLLKYAYAESRPDGFIVDEARPDRVEGRFIERIEMEDSFLNSHGDETTFTRIEYNVTRFVASWAPPCLQMINSPRCVKRFVARLSEASRFQVTVIPMSVDVGLWLSELQSIYVGQMCVEDVTVSYFDERKFNVVVRIQGKSISEKAVNDIVTRKAYSIDRMTFRLSGEIDGKVTLKSSAAATITSKHELQIQNLLDQTIHLGKAL
ncbi:hypothetical protein [Salinarimonas sp.]|uniref:hypothetical protein n=1 Tax=Salinarimonas sp. TaxID=2766526 RepID=UPI003919C88B